METVGGGDDPLSQFVRHIAPTVSEQDRQDIAQETRLRELSHAKSAPSDQAGLLRWRHAIARNLVRDRWRRLRPVRTSDAPTTAPAADDQLIRLAEGEMVRRAFLELDQLSRNVLFLRVVEARPADEVARLLDRSPAAVRQIQHRALLRLRRRLAAAGWDDRPGVGS